MSNPALRVPDALVVAASVSYAGSCALGALAAVRKGSTRRVRLLHHGLYISTFSLTAAAAGTSLMTRHRAGLPLWGAMVPLGLIAAFDARSSAHIGIAACAAPFYTASIVLSRKG